MMADRRFLSILRYEFFVYPIQFFYFVLYSLLFFGRRFSFLKLTYDETSLYRRNPEWVRET
jgi:hypothetical protein